MDIIFEERFGNVYDGYTTEEWKTFVGNVWYWREGQWAWECTLNGVAGKEPTKEAAMQALGSVARQALTDGDLPWLR